MNKHGPKARSSKYDALSVELIRAGLPMSALEELAKDLQIERALLAEILGVSIRTLQRKAGVNERLGPAASDRLARGRRIHDVARHCLGGGANAALGRASRSRD